MDIVRYYLAISVIVTHAAALTGMSLWWPTSSYNAVCGFFALSGFLVYPSFLRHKSFWKFLKGRGRRILPSYLFIVIVCAFMLAPLSTLPAADYFTSREWWAYIGANLTFLNFLQPSLPGVFDSPEFYNNAVNGSLWTMKVEWALYLSVPLVAYVTSKLKPRYLLPAFWTILATSILWRMAFTYLYESTGKEIYNILGRQFFGQLSYFYAGVILYYKRGWLLEHKIVSLALITAAILVTDIIPFGYIIISPLAVSAAVIYVSIVGDWGKRLSRHDNISYDMYLFHYPIIQVAVYFGMGRLPEIVLLAVIIAATVVLAYLERRFVRWLFYRQSNNT